MEKEREEEREKFQPYFDGTRIVYPLAASWEQDTYEYLDRRDPFLRRYYENGNSE